MKLLLILLPYLFLFILYLLKEKWTLLWKQSDGFLLPSSIGANIIERDFGVSFDFQLLSAYRKRHR